jgi:hypothetical protein
MTAIKHLHKVTHQFMARPFKDPDAAPRPFKPGETVWVHEDDPPGVFRVDRFFKWQADDPIQFSQSMEPFTKPG